MGKVVGMVDGLNNELVRYSRAGDAFHYRWAARRCLKMIYPSSPVKYIVIEGSKERKLAGEYVIDVSEYLGKDEDENKETHYFQLKHTTVRKEKPFTLSGLKDTITGFADRYKEHLKNKTNGDTHFYLVTNRPIAEKLKKNIKKIQNKKPCEKRFLNTMERYTKLKGKRLVGFCKCFTFMDGMGDYNEQLLDLQVEISQLLAGTADHPQIDTITSLVGEKALPNSDGVIYPEDILKRFGCTSVGDMYPAPAEFERNDDIIWTKQQQKLTELILKSQEAIIIHAAGGVGKSVFAREIPRFLTDDSIAVIFDSFGAGKYRNRSQPRHRYRDGLIQIVNELAGIGLCDPLIAQSAALEDEILRKFLYRLQTAIDNLKKINQKAQIIIVIDAADNAEMAAKEFGQTCFVHELLYEKLPDGCHLVMLCRTERMELLQPDSSVKTYELLPFSEQETLFYLRKRYPEATEADGLEFHRLTDGNPRIQANALDVKLEHISEVLENLGPRGTTIEKQIESQLDKAVEKVKEKLPRSYRQQIDAICCGLATLPPFIPITILATVAEVEEAAVKSFVAELGRPIWIADAVVQFRDEPTETWFRQRFSGIPQQIANYVELLKPLADRFTYVAEVLPHLYLQAGLYPELIELALSDALLPRDNPIDRRNVRIYRLQFAFKAALRIKQYGDAVKIAMLAGEEMAGDKRQLEIFKKNVHLIAPLQDSQKVQELAFKRILRGAWEGAENIYAASLLSNVPEFHGEARSYLRASRNWLNIYFEERSKKEDQFRSERLEHEEITEMAFAYYHLLGAEAAVKFMLSWKPPTVIYHVAGTFAQKMIDLNHVDLIVEMARLGAKEVFFILALTNELLKVGKFPNSEVLIPSLDLLSKGRVKMPKLEESFRYNILTSVISFAEICAVHKLPNGKINHLLSRYFPGKLPVTFDSNYRSEIRGIFLRVIALRKSLCSDMDVNVDKLLPEKFSGIKKNYQYEQDTRKYKEMLDGLLPWYVARIQILLAQDDDLEKAIQTAKEDSRGALHTSYQQYNIMDFEMAQVYIDILLFCRESTDEQIKKFFSESIINNQHIWMDSRLQALRGANRLEHLSAIRSQLDEYVHDCVANCGEETETRAEYYIGLSRATIAVSMPDAAEYFNLAIEIVSRFGDEIVIRWRAVAALANQSCKEKFESAELAYRFIRCGELIGENVAREKYFDRNGAMRICAKLSPSSGLAALSRWRDRDVGWFEDQFPVVAEEIVAGGFISPIVAWGLLPLFEEADLPKFVMTCLRKEASIADQEKILDSAIDYLRRYNTPATVWQGFKELADELGIKNKKLENICLFYTKNERKKTKDVSVHESGIGEYKFHHIEEAELESIFAGLDLTCPKDIDTALQRFHDVPDSYRNKDTFWEYFFTQVPQGDIAKFLEALLASEQIDFYEIDHAFSHLPEHWKKKLSVMRRWPDIVKLVAKFSALKLLDSYGQERISKVLKIKDSERHLVYEGMIEGLISQENLGTADVFFGFVKSIADMLELVQARELLEFSLTRFELHMEDDFADGKWAQWLQPPDDSSRALTGFIWSALGSPSSEIRWKAAHCVKQLGENGCQNEIDALLKWLNQDWVAAFGSNQFPFYNLHARLYFFIALARLSVNRPELLLKHALQFSHYALNDMPHILIQLFAANIALNIECVFPGTYEASVFELLKNVSSSPFPRKETKSYHENIPSYWHQTGKVNTDLHFHHGYDFDRYWFEPLGRIFGVSGQQVEELTTAVIVEEWKIGNDGSYLNDPRQVLWNSSRYQNKTYHSYGGYPSVETYSFYLSYHAMFVVASRLLQNMPVLFKAGGDDEDAWDRWLRRRSLTRNDGFWLFDRRDAAPLQAPSWLQENIPEEWTEKISDDYFLETLLLNDQQDNWLNVYGSWEYGGDSDSYREQVLLASALVSSDASQALLNALSSCEDPHDYKLPEYQEEEMEFDLNPFHLKGWVVNDDLDEGLDKLDKLVGQIYYPAYRIGELIAEKLSLREDEQYRNWYMGGQREPCLTCQDWSYEIAKYGETEQLRGMRLSASLEMLKELCAAEECELIIEVQIERRIKESRYSRQNSEKAYVTPKHKIYILSPKGELRDEHGSVELRKVTR